MSEFISLLERVPETKKSDISELWGDIPEKASSLIGYDFLHKHTEHLTLENALNETESRPFTFESVEKYKKEVARNANRFLFFHRIVDKVLSTAAIVMMLCFGPALLGWFVSWRIGLAFVLGFLGSAGTFVFLLDFTQKSKGEWKTTALKGYAQPIPEFVLIQAIALKERLPSAEFFVQEFMQDKKVLDPFLSIHCFGEEHTIAVWNEPKFEAKQKI